MAKKKAAPKKKKAAPKKKVTKVIDEPLKTVVYKMGDLIDGYEILEEAAARTKKKDPMPFDIEWNTSDGKITLHILGGVSIDKKKK
jgi:hypothetical protein